MTASDTGFIAGTNTRVSTARLQAKQIRNQLGIRLKDALEIVAQQHFQRDWRSLLAQQTPDPHPSNLSYSDRKSRWLSDNGMRGTPGEPRYLVVASTPDWVVLQDESDWGSQFASITNAAQQVVWEVAVELAMLGNRRLAYFDTNGRLDELKIVKLRFGGHAPIRAGERTELLGSLTDSRVDEDLFGPHLSRNLLAIAMIKEICRDIPRNGTYFTARIDYCALAQTLNLPRSVVSKIIDYLSGQVRFSLSESLPGNVSVRHSVDPLNSLTSWRNGDVAYANVFPEVADWLADSTDRERILAVMKGDTHARPRGYTDELNEAQEGWDKFFLGSWTGAAGR